MGRGDKRTKKGKINSGLGDLEIYVQTDVDYITTLTQ